MRRAAARRSRQVYRVGKTMDDVVQPGKVHGTTRRKNKHNEGVHNGRKDSGNSRPTGGERLGSDGTQSNEWKQTCH